MTIDWSQAPADARWHFRSAKGLESFESRYYKEWVGVWTPRPADVYASLGLDEQKAPVLHAMLDGGRGALDTQEGGDHYKKLQIQPIEYITANNLDYMQGNVVKYITRHKDKNGAQDVRKVIHYCELILQLQYGE